jgi:hypothetical protein
MRREGFTWENELLFKNFKITVLCTSNSICRAISINIAATLLLFGKKNEVEF